MNFKECLANDIENVFMNVNEFGEKAVIDDVEMTIVRDEDLLEKKKLSNGAEGLAESEILFHTSTSNFIEEPFVDDIMRFNGERYVIRDVKESNGLYSITLAGNRS